MANMNYRDAVLGFLFVLVVVMVGFMVGPAIETRFFPVYGKFVLISTETDGKGTIAQFRYEKLRECQAQGFAWYVGELGAGSRQIPVKPTGQINPSRSVGVHVTTPYMMDVSEEQLRNGVRAEIFNRCHPFWITRSEIYP